MEIIKTFIEDLVIIQPNVFEDERGSFMESFKDSFIKENFPEIYRKIEMKKSIFPWAVSFRERPGTIMYRNHRKNREKDVLAMTTLVLSIYGK